MVPGLMRLLWILLHEKGLRMFLKTRYKPSIKVSYHYNYYYYYYLTLCFLTILDIIPYETDKSVFIFWNLCSHVQNEYAKTHLTSPQLKSIHLGCFSKFHLKG